MAEPSPTNAHRRRIFNRLLVNALAAGTTATFIWFALTFWVYITTKSVVATAIISGAFSLSAAFVGVPFGTFVDRHTKRSAMLLSSGVATACFVGAGLVYVAAPSTERLLSFRGPWFWLLITFTLAGAVVGSMRGIAMSTCVSLLVEEDRRPKANGMVGTVTGISFTVSSIFSGLGVGGLGMGWCLVITIVVMAVSTIDLCTFTIPGDVPAPASDNAPRVDFSGAIAAIRSAPGLMMLIAFAAVNNLLGGVFMALMDAYGLSMVSVQTWGLLWGILSLGFIVGGLIVVRTGVSPRPLRLIVLLNICNWTICSVFALRSSIWMLAVGMGIWLTAMPVIEAAEQTVLQRAIPFEQQGRVFGFAQTVESAASPLTSFAIGPIAETVFMPTMSAGGRGADWIGGWFGVGPERGLALLFTVAGWLGIVATVAMAASRSYRTLSSRIDAAA
jgi:MFS transporter, DHA3 family, multidrug efflux protein